MSSNDSSLVEAIEDSVEHFYFGWVNYSLFTAMLFISTAIGSYFGFFAKKQETTTEYLLGGKTMSYFPVAMSLTASHLSGITLLGIPSEVYRFGTQYTACVVTTTMLGLVTAYIFLPVFHKLQLTSTFEYLELRFARPVRLFASVVFTISLILHTPIVIYGPALAFSQVTGINLHYVTPFICIVCIFYTAIGGLKALVWTDTIQFMVTILTLFTVMTIGIVSVGGFGEIWRISDEGGRLIFFDMNPNPAARSTFWGITIGLASSWIAQISVNQGCMQRFLAVPTLSEAKLSVGITCVGLIIMKYVSIYSGLIMYAKYHDCDPIMTNQVNRPDQILPFYVMDIAGKIPGLPGLFMAALVSAAFSSMSSGLNTAAGTIWEDFISPWVPESETKEQTATKVMKVTVVVLGVLCVAMVFVVEHMGEIFAMSTSMNGVTAGTIIGLFTLGVLVPWANYKGAVTGGIIGFITSTWIIVGGQLHTYYKHIRYDQLPSSVENCSYPLNMTDWANIKPTLPPLAPEDEPMILFTVSFLYYSLIGASTVIITGIIASILFGGSDFSELNKDHFAPIIRRFLPREKYTEVPLKNMPVISRSFDREKQTM